MVKAFLNRHAVLFVLVLLTLLFAQPVLASNEYSSLFVKITDATLALEDNNQELALEYLSAIEDEFAQVVNSNSEAGKNVQKAISDAKILSKEKLVAISSALMAFDAEQHPVDEEAEKERLWTRLKPEFQRFQEALNSKEQETLRQAYKQLNTTWTRVEGVVRKDSAHYGNIETNLSFLRSAIEATPFDIDFVVSQFDSLEQAVQDFLEGRTLATSNQQYSLEDGVSLLQSALTHFQKGDAVNGSASMREFITIWPIIEGDVSTRNPSLYTRIESEAPIIMVKGVEQESQETLSELIQGLSAIDITAMYHFGDAALILLREGFEALLIVFALISSIKAAKQRKGLPWIYGGAVVGLLLSIVTAILLQALFPVMTSGANREILEGFVGIVAVIMMLFVGIWLHGKSNVTKWNAYMDKQMKMATSTGNFFSLFLLSFLAVFREGAETILFYAGMMPRIEWNQLLLGIGIAVLILAISALLFTKMARRFVAYKMFFWMSWMIYGLAFKMLGVSIHALQLTALLPSHYIHGLKAIDVIGFYPTWESALPQALFLAIVVFVTWRQRNENYE